LYGREGRVEGGSAGEDCDQGGGAVIRSSFVPSW